MNLKIDTVNFLFTFTDAGSGNIAMSHPMLDTTYTLLDSTTLNYGNTNTVKKFIAYYYDVQNFSTTSVFYYYTIDSLSINYSASFGSYVGNYHSL